MTTLPLNPGQEAAAEGFFEFLFGPHKEMIISGPGGYGKTFLMGHMIDRIMPRYFETCRMMGIEPEYESVEMCATTNKAAEVLAHETGRPAGTIQSYLNLKVKDDYETGVSRLEKTDRWVVHENKILFVDECSMIDTQLHQYLLQGTHKSKIVYVGDHCQLAPVAEPISPIFKEEKPFFVLSEPMRTKDPHLMAVQAQLRQTVETGVFHPIQIVPGVIDHLDDTQLQQELVLRFSQQTHEARILAFRNDRVMQFNDHIRTIRGLPDEYTEGEYLVNASAIRTRHRMLSVEEEVSLSYLGKKETVEIKDVEFEFRRATLRDQFGVLHDVKLPVDRVHHHALMKYFARKREWTTYYHLKNIYPDLRQRDAATVHKAQGSTYDTVIIDLGDISRCNIPSMVARMLYVAFTRPRSRILLYGDLASKYGGLIQ